MKKKYLSILFLLLIFLSGCSIKEVHVKSLTAEEASKESLLMIANTDIECLSARIKMIIAKGTIFKAYDLSNITYYSREKDKLIDFPKESIYLKSWESDNKQMTLGYLIYPNGQFVFENYKVVLITGFKSGFNSGVPSQLYPAECKYKGNIIFTPKKN